MKLNKKCTTKPYYFLVNNTILASVMKNCNIILTEKQQKSLHYYQAKFVYFPKGKKLVKQEKNQNVALKFLNPCKKIDGLKKLRLYF